MATEKNNANAYYVSPVVCVVFLQMDDIVKTSFTQEVGGEYRNDWDFFE